MMKLIETKLPLKERSFDPLLTANDNGRGYASRPALKKLVGIWNASIDVENTNFNKVDPKDTDPMNQNVLYLFKSPYSYRREEKVGYYACVILKGRKAHGDSIEAGDILILNNGDRFKMPRAKDLSVASPKFCKEYAFAAFIMDDELKTTTEIRNQRRDSKAGMLTRVNPEDSYWGMDVDKSGYVFDKDKYKKMLITYNQDKYVKPFEEVIGFYNKFTNKLNELQNKEFDLNNKESTNNFIQLKWDLEKYVKEARGELSSFASVFKRNDKSGIVYYAKRISGLLNRGKELDKEHFSEV